MPHKRKHWQRNILSTLTRIFWELPGCNIYIQVAPDLLHQYFLGMVKAYLEALLAFLHAAQDGKVLISRLDECFKNFPNWQGSRTFKDGVSSLKFVTASTMKYVLLKLPLAVYGLRLTKSCYHELATKMLDWWYIQATTGEMTEEHLLKLQKIEDDVGALIITCGFSSHFKTVKNHYMLHYTPFIMMFEDPDLLLTQTGEMCHKKKMVCKREVRSVGLSMILGPKYFRKAPFTNTQENWTGKTAAEYPLDSYQNISDPGFNQFLDYLIAYLSHYSDVAVTSALRAEISALTISRKKLLLCEPRWNEKKDNLFSIISP
jgi:hypothetical protein